ncbi:sulfatase [Geomonas propionica]|uniref:Sulfatase n=1 Tax=Geomonas propionica TaxID=2798582 RepID=A0ABS0YW29_9BACT|nr:sulfatase [Geomonas propionica]MBJ6801947.1 sulfatase [Geomonas propionica]
MPVSFPDRLLYLFRLWCCFLLLGVVPLDLVYRLDSLLLSLSPLQVAVNGAALGLIMVLLAAVIALPAAVCSLACSRLAAACGLRTDEQVGLLTEVTLFFLFACNFARVAKVFFLKIGYPINVSYFPLLAGSLLWGAVLYRSRGNFHAEARRLVEVVAGRRFIAAFTAAALVVTTLYAGAEAFREAPLPSAHLTPAANGKRPNMILITFDALSAEDMSLYGYHLPTTPNIDAFAKECYIFDNAVAAANWTKPGVASILTGKLPVTHRMINTSPWGNAPPQPDSLPAVLKRAGYTTSALCVNWNYAHPYVNGTYRYFDNKDFTGFDMSHVPPHQRPALYLTQLSLLLQSRLHLSAPFWFVEIYNGFAWYLDPRFPATRPTMPPHLIFDQARDLASRRDDNPFFLWLHTVPPHGPYLAGPFKGTFLPGDRFTDSMSQIRYGFFYDKKDQGAMNQIRLRYDENIRYADDEFGRYLRFLRESGRLDDSIVVICADHGESFSHGFFSHGLMPLYRPVLHIPLLIHLPGQKETRLLREAVSQTDVAPSLLDLAGCPVPPSMDGRSLRRELDGAPAASRPIFSMNLEGNPTKGHIVRGSVAVQEGSYKYIRYLGDGTELLFDVERDPKESRNLAGSESQRKERLRRLAAELLRQP